MIFNCVPQGERTQQRERERSYNTTQREREREKIHHTEREGRGEIRTVRDRQLIILTARSTFIKVRRTRIMG